MLKRIKKNWMLRLDNPKKGDGFTLVELVVAAGILVVAITGILISYVRCMELNEVSKNMSLCLQSAESKLSEIKSTDFTLVKTTFHQISFNVSGIDAKGVSYVDDSDPELLEVVVSISWQQKNGRIFGDDANLNGTIESGEDSDGNFMLDSPVQLTTYIFDRS